jgi:hypothetical protein
MVESGSALEPQRLFWLPAPKSRYRLSKVPIRNLAATSVALQNFDLAETSIDLGQFPSDRTSS